MVLLAFIAFGLLFTVAMGAELWIDGAILTQYHEGRATVVSKRKIEHPEPSGEKKSSWQAEVTFDHEVDGKTHRVSGLDGHSGRRETSETDVDHILRGFKVGHEVPCWYDPEDPSQAVVIRGSLGRHLPIFMFPFGFTLISIFVLARMFGSRRPLAAGTRLAVRLRPETGRLLGIGCVIMLLAIPLMLLPRLGGIAWQDLAVWGIWIVAGLLAGVFFPFMVLGWIRTGGLSVEASTNAVHPGEAVQVSVAHTPRLGQPKDVTVSLVCEESRRKGSDVLCSLEGKKRDGPPSEHCLVEKEFLIPRDARLADELVSWKVRVHLRYGPLSSHVVDFPFQVGKTA